jgi:2-dehydropantoate 2-reductase
METIKYAVIGIGATGTVLAAALINSGRSDTVLVGSDRLPAKINGLNISGALKYETPVSNYINNISCLKNFNPQIVFITTKTFHLDKVLESLKTIANPDTKIVSCQNGLGPEDIISEQFSPERVFRISLNYGASTSGPGRAEVAFFNSPNQLGALSPIGKEAGLAIAEALTAGGLDTEFVDDVKFHVWKKMIMKCTMASICAVTDMTIKDALNLPPAREIAEACFNEAINVAKAMGYDLGSDYIPQVMGYLARVGAHRDSMCYDIAANRPTEIDFLGGKIAEYGRRCGIPTPCFNTMTNLIKALEAKGRGLSGKLVK